MTHAPGGARPLLGFSSTTGFTSDLAEEARRRFALACLIYALGYTLAYGVPRFFGVDSTRIERTIPDTVVAGAIVLALGFWLINVRDLLSTRRCLQLAAVFQVIGAYGISAVESWATYAGHVERGLPVEVWGISWVCVWIIFFPIVVPGSRRQTLLAALASASAPPALFLLNAYTFRTVATVDLGPLLVSVTVPPVVSAGASLLTLKIIRAMEAKVSEARRLGAYELVEKLGQGGMGEVWLARHQILARPAALKIIREAKKTGLDGNPSPITLQRFEREAQATARLRCPHTISLYDFGVAADGTFYHVMELLEGLDLETLVRTFGPQPPERTAHLIAQVCLSLEEAHSHGMVHRDIKPANIFCCHYGLQFDFVKVLDFGLVKTLDIPRESGALRPLSSSGPIESERPLTETHEIAGTPAYMPPEVVRREEVGPGADIYSLGGVAYWLLTGRFLFKANNPIAMALKHTTDLPLPPSARIEHPIPEALDSLVLRCLAKEPDSRPTAAELRVRLIESTTRPWGDREAEAWWRLNRSRIPGAPDPSTARESTLG